MVVKRILTSLFVGFIVLSSWAQELKLNGVYQGDNLYVMNPFASTGVGFCIQEVRVNNKVSTDEIASSAFEIDLSQYHFKVGDPVEITIKHKSGCKPKILNPNVIQPKSTFVISRIEVGRDKILRWSTTDESGSLDYIIEQYRWNKWVKVGTVKGDGNKSGNQYSIKVSPHSGQNKFRVKQIDYSKKPRYSQEAIFRSMAPAVSYKKTNNEISFTQATLYEIYDYYGNVVKVGDSDKIDISQLKSGDYFLNYDNKMETFKKK
ncbi:MAG: hypothetical protein JXR60_12125 [Bacteroidales bacterium]|nr:hypothetical protein [Bacteroidales bacterium]